MNFVFIKTSNDISDFESYINSGYKEYAVDLEGDNLCRHGKINFIQICVVETSRIFIFDMSELSIADTHRALNPIFSDITVSKYMFDCRSDSDALYHQLNIKLVGVVDVQLYEIGFRKCKNFGTRFYKGLFKTLQEYSHEIGVTSNDLDIKKKYSDQFNEKNYKLDLNDRDVQRYLAIDVLFLKNLYTIFNRGITNAKIRSKINLEARTRENTWMKDVFVKDRRNAISVI